MKTKHIRSAQTQNGSALITALGFLVFFIIVATMISVMAQTRENVGQYNVGRTIALHAAEAGLEDALQIALDSGPDKLKLTEQPFGDDFYTISVQETKDTIMLQSLGRVPPKRTGLKISVRRKIWAQVVEDSRACAAAGGDIRINGNSSCVGLTYAQRNLEVRSNSMVDGPGEALGVIDLRSSGTVTGKKSAQNYPPAPKSRSFSIPEAEQIRNTAQNAGVHTGDMLITGTVQNLGPVLITGDLTIKQGATIQLQGDIYVEGEINIDGSAVYGAYILYSGAGDDDDDMHDGRVRINSSTVGEPGKGPLISAAGGDNDDDDGLGDDDDEMSLSAMAGDHEDGPGAIRIEKSTVYAQVYAPTASIRISQTELHGEVVGWTLYVNNQSIVLQESIKANGWPKGWAVAKAVWYVQ